MIISLLFGLLLLVPEDPYVLVLTNNKKMKIQAPPQCGGKLCTVVLMNGEKTSIPARMIDHARTETYNQELLEKKEAARLAAEEAEKARQEAAAKEAEAEAKKEIVLRSNDDLPEYDDSLNAVGGIPQPADETAGMIGEPQYRSFKSTDPVFIQSEKVTRYADRHEIECVLKTNVQNGVQDVKVHIKVNFEDGAPVEQSRQAGLISVDGEVAVVFVLQGGSPLIQTRYVIDYNTVE